MENKKIIRSDNHVCLNGWMINELDLSGNELIVYAVIWGFTQDGNQWCTASQAYIARWANITTRALIKILNKLEEKGLLIKEKNTCRKGFECKYRAVRPGEEEQDSEQEADVNKVHIRREQSSYPDVNKVHIRCEQSSHNNIEDNIEDNIDYKENIKRKSEADLKQDFEELWKLYPRKRGKEAAYKAYKKAIKEGTTNEEIRQGIMNLLEDIRKNRTEERFIPYGSTFFNGKGWTDELGSEIRFKTCGDNRPPDMDLSIFD